MTTALTRTAWYPLLKNVSKAVATKTLTKEGLKRGVTKFIPIIGGILSGVINVATILPMANRLKNELRKYYY